MEHKIKKVVEEIKNATHIDENEKPLILEKIEEWKKEKAAISDLTSKLEVWWLKVEPIFAEIGLV
jgi:predicted nucleic-acid-binding protein